ncbi:putative ribonuclease H-like domain-containing protein [Tanacetum coccineum]
MSHLSYNTIDYESLFSSHRPNEYMPFSDATYSTSDVCEWQESVALFENQDVRQHPINVQTPLVLLRSTCGGGDVGGGGVIATAVSRGDGGDGGEVRHVKGSGVGDRIDPVVRSTFGVSPKSPPEKFSGGGDVVVAVDLQGRLKSDQGIFDSGCSRHMTGNKSFLIDYQDIDGGFVAFAGSPKGGKITRKGKIRTEKLDFKDVYFVKELKFNPFFVSQMCDKKNSVLFTETECLVLSLDFKLLDESQVLLKVPRQNNMYSFDLKNVVPLGGCSAVDGAWVKRLLKNQQIRVKDMAKRRKEEIQIKKVTRIFINANDLPTDPLMPDFEDTTDLLNTGIFNGAYDDEDVGAEADLNNLETTMNVSPIPTTRIHKDHPKEQIIGDLLLAPQTRRMTKSSQEHAMVSYIKKQRRTNHKDYQNCLFACFLSQIEPKKVTQALTDPSWIEAMQDELLQFRLQKVYRNKKDKRGIVVRNKARLVAQGYTQEEGIDYDEVFALVARIEAIRLFLAYASFMGFIVYQMDVKSAFLYGTIEEEVYVCQPPGFEDPQFPDKVYKVEKALYGLHQAPRAWYETLSTYLLENRFRRGTIDKTLFIKKDKGDILLVQVQQALLEDEEAEDVDVHLYRSMIGSLMYLTASRPDIMFVLVQDSPFDLEAFSDSDYTGSSLDRKSIIRVDFLNASTISNEMQIHAKVDGKTIVISESSVRSNLHFNDEDGVTSLTNSKILENLALMGYEITQTPRRAKRGQDTKIPQFGSPPKKVGDEAVYTEVDDRVVRTATTASSLEAEQESGNIYKTRFKTTLNEPTPLGNGLGSGPRCQDTTLGDVDAQTRFETASKQSRNPPLLEVNTSRSGEDRVNTPGSNEGRLNIKELIAVCTNLSKRVLALETLRTAQDLIGASKRKSLDKENVSKHGRNLKTRLMFEECDFDDDFDDIDDMVNKAMKNVEGDTVNAAGAVNNVTTGVSAAIALVTSAGVSISTAKPRTPPTTTTTAFEDEDLTIAQTLVKMISQKDKEKEKGVAFRAAQEESARPTRILPTIDPKDKGKGIMQEPKKPPKNLIKAQIQRDAKIA